MYLTASIVTYKEDEKVLLRTIESFLNTDFDVRLYIVDNSPSNSLKDLCKDKNIEYYHGHGNIGFGAAHNLILSCKEKVGLYHLVLNPDIYFDKGVLEELCCFLDKNEDVGLITPKVFYPNGDIQYLCKLLPRPIDWLGRLLIPINIIKQRINDRFELKFTNYDKIMNIPYISGCFMLLRSSVINEIGVFDESIFMYGEDTDLTRRIHTRYKTIYYPYVSIFHEFHKGSYKSFRLFKIHVKAAIYYFNKWGWFIDKERKVINNKVLKELEYNAK